MSAGPCSSRRFQKLPLPASAGSKSSLAWAVSTFDFMWSSVCLYHKFPSAFLQGHQSLVLEMTLKFRIITLKLNCVCKGPFFRIRSNSQSRSQDLDLTFMGTTTQPAIVVFHSRMLQLYPTVAEILNKNNTLLFAFSVMEFDLDCLGFSFCTNQAMHYLQEYLKQRNFCKNCLHLGFLSTLGKIKKIQG